ncbi:Uncharacterized protein OS=Planctomyces maris DSM 8797 GN=PM8797T_06637 PE=4 SV=1 [Gemmataceae bacterium]|nr:Uncharacterized protein OS=Planctomyces maris DSM 8797 GN=PM8797T_06637 PE=4 SV=1 [Gemmataceae bacterium]VTU01606.1 Uncharacterized protein OS=Planctomyces maris DSM 8797 GN=PM8797T_06637 PE=4 SV=1 [Gemmataceae bacterium]
MRGRRVRAVAAATVLAAAAGCGGGGPERVPVEGKLTACGTPLAGASVQFLPDEGTKGEGGLGSSDPGGAFRLTGSRDGADGVPPGKYRVRVSRLVNKDGTVLPADAKQAEYPSARESIPAPYSAPNSPLVVSVPEAGGPLAVDLPVKVTGGKR